MKTLYLCRHAKSSWEGDLPDDRRPLNKRGERDAALVSARVAAGFDRPERIISSHAVRARTTAGYFADAYNIKGDDFAIDRHLYDFSGESAFQVIKGCPDDIDSLMVFGHNNAFTWLADELGNKPVHHLPTCGFVALEFEVDSWKDIVRGRTLATVFPREVRE